MHESLCIVGGYADSDISVPGFAGQRFESNMIGIDNLFCVSIEKLSASGQGKRILIPDKKRCMFSFPVSAAIKKVFKYSRLKYCSMK